MEGGFVGNGGANAADASCPWSLFAFTATAAFARILPSLGVLNPMRTHHPPQGQRLRLRGWRWWGGGRDGGGRGCRWLVVMSSVVRRWERFEKSFYRQATFMGASLGNRRAPKTLHRSASGNLVHTCTIVAKTP